MKSYNNLNWTMLKKYNRLFSVVTILLIVLTPGCQKSNHPVAEKFKIVSEAKTNKDSPFFIDTKKYPSKRNSLPVGIFDSGTGGLSVLNSILEQDKFNNVTHEPGTDSIPDFEAYGLETVREAVDFWGLNIPILGIIDAGAKNVLSKLKPGEENNAVIGVLATEGTCASGGYPAYIKNNAEQIFPDNNIRVVQQAGIGLAGAIDGDLNYIDQAAKTVRGDEDYKGPELNHLQFPIDTNLWTAYNFDTGNGLLIEKNDEGEMVIVQLNSINNYIKYCTTHLVVKTVEENPNKVLNSIILGCTHYPFFVNEIRNHLMFLKQLEEKYNKIIPGDISFTDPAHSLANDLYNCLAKNNLWGADNNINSEFFISVPNPHLASNKIDTNGEFPYAYKYGRDINSSNQFVKIVPFSDKWINKSIKARIKQNISTTFKVIYKN